MNRQDELEVTLALSPVNKRLRHNPNCCIQRQMLCGCRLAWFYRSRSCYIWLLSTEAPEHFSSASPPLYNITPTKEHHGSLRWTGSPSIPMTRSFLLSDPMLPNRRGALSKNNSHKQTNKKQQLIFFLKLRRQTSFTFTLSLHGNRVPLQILLFYSQFPL